MPCILNLVPRAFPFFKGKALGRLVDPVSPSDDVTRLVKIILQPVESNG